VKLLRFSKNCPSPKPLKYHVFINSGLNDNFSFIASTNLMTEYNVKFNDASNNAVKNPNWGGGKLPNLDFNGFEKLKIKLSDLEL
jgi:hypothetical protein